MELDNAKQSPESTWLLEVRKRVSSMQFGSVNIVVHGGQIVQIEATEKVRLDKSGRTGAEHAPGGEPLV